MNEASTIDLINALNRTVKGLRPTKVLLHGHLSSDIAIPIKEKLSDRIDALGYKLLCIDESDKGNCDYENDLARNTDIQKAMMSSEIIITMGPPTKEWTTQMYMNVMNAKAFHMKGDALWIPLLYDADAKRAAITTEHYFIAKGKEPHDIVSDLEEMIVDYLQEKRGEFNKQKKRDKDVSTFVKTAIDSLEARELLDKWIAMGCYLIGFIAVVLSLYFANSSLVAAVKDIPPEQWIKFIFVSVKVSFTIALGFACSKYAFNLGNSFMNEARKNGSRIHAIRFGELYLKIYGDTVQPEDVKDIFQHWNIDRDSTFSTLDADKYDPKIFDKAIDLAKVALEKVKTDK